jgi:hypothetical protein
MGHRTEAPSAELSGRLFDIERTVRELTLPERWRAEFLNRHAGPKATKKQLIDASSIIDPDVTDAEYRLMRLRLYFCNEACDNYIQSTDKEAALLNRSTSAIERASKGLERSKDKQDNYQISTRRKDTTSLRSFDVHESKQRATAELSALLKPAKMRETKTADLQVSETAEMQFEAPFPANLQPVSRKHAGITLNKNSKRKITHATRGPSPTGDEREVDSVIAEYNVHAQRMGWVQEIVTPPKKRGWIKSRINQLDGAANVLLALSAAPDDDYLKKLGDGMSLDYLLKTNGKDWLSLLFNRAKSRANSASLDDFEAEVTRFAQTDIGRKIRQSRRDHDQGMELIRDHLRKQREKRANAARANEVHHD